MHKKAGTSTEHLGLEEVIKIGTEVDNEFLNRRRV